MRIIKEHEWKYCARAGTSTVFPFGNTLPNETDLNIWMNFEFNNLNSVCLTNPKTHAQLFPKQFPQNELVNIT